MRQLGLVYVFICNMRSRLYDGKQFCMEYVYILPGQILGFVALLKKYDGVVVDSAGGFTTFLRLMCLQ